MKLRFRLTADRSVYEVLAVRKTTRKWEVVGTCHISARDDVKAGKLELIRLRQ